MAKALKKNDKSDCGIPSTVVILIQNESYKE